MSNRRKSKRRQWKYRNIVYRSKFEMGIGKSLSDRKAKFKYERENYKYKVRIPHAECDSCGSTEVSKLGYYTPDFFLSNGIIVEAKGKFTPAERKKMQAMKEQHPDLDIRMVFQTDNWLTRSHSKRYSDWCISHDIPYAVGDVPDEWLEE